MVSILDPVRAALEGLDTVETGVINLLTDLHDRLVVAIAGQDLAGAQALADEINTQKARLAAAITANTVAAPNVAPEAPVEITDPNAPGGISSPSGVAAAVGDASGSATGSSAPPVDSTAPVADTTLADTTTAATTTETTPSS